MFKLDIQSTTVGTRVKLCPDSPHYPNQCRVPRGRTDMVGTVSDVITNSRGVWVKWDEAPRAGAQVNFYMVEDLYYADPKERIQYYDYKLSTEMFNSMAESRITNTIQVMINKGAEYALDGDRFHNFKQASKLTLETEDPQTPKQCLMGMLMKHLVSVQDLCNGSLDNTEGMVNEKIGDSIAYLLLLEGLLMEERNATA